MPNSNLGFFPNNTERLKPLSYKGKQLILVDYSGLNELEMIALTNKHKDLVVAEKNESYFIANYESSYATADYMKAAHEFTIATKPYIVRGAFLGIRGAKVALLKGVTYFLKVDFRACDNEMTALEFLVS